MAPKLSLPVLKVSEFIELLNSILETAFPRAEISGEVANIRVSQNKWLYFDLKDDTSSLKFFGTVWQLPGPVEDGMMLTVRGRPQLSHRYGFSVHIESIKHEGEGSLRRAAELLLAKLKAEGLFDPARKRQLPHPPTRIGLITSSQSAAYTDFIRVIGSRWGGLTIELIDVPVQGDSSAEAIVLAVDQFNSQAKGPDVLVLIRGGGSTEDLAAFSTESVTRAVAASRIPTLVAVGHERDVSLAELAADRREATPSTAAECLVPAADHERLWLQSTNRRLYQLVQADLNRQKEVLDRHRQNLKEIIAGQLKEAEATMLSSRRLLNAYSPTAVLNRGYAIIKFQGKIIRRVKTVQLGDSLGVYLSDGQMLTTVEKVKAN